MAGVSQVFTSHAQQESTGSLKQLKHSKSKTSRSGKDEGASSVKAAMFPVFKTLRPQSRGN
jgi:hypothetical protein